MVKRNKLLWKKEKNIKKHELCTKGKFILKRKEEFNNFSGKEKVDIINLWE